MRVTTNVKFSWQYQCLLVRKGMADAILPKSVLEVFFNSIFLCPLCKFSNIFSRNSICRRNKMVFSYPNSVRVPNLVKFNSFLGPFFKYLNDSGSRDIMNHQLVNIGKNYITRSNRPPGRCTSYYFFSNIHLLKLNFDLFFLILIFFTEDKYYNLYLYK